MKHFFEYFLAKLKTEHASNELRQFELFSKMTVADLKIIHELMYMREYKSGEKLYETGYPMELIFFIQEGEILLMHDDPDTLFECLGPGEVLGFRDLDSSDKRSHNAQAKSHLKILALSKRDLLELRKNPGRLASKLNTAIEQEIQKIASRSQPGESK